MEVSRIPGQDQPVQDPDCSPPGVDGDPLQPTQPSYGGGMAEEEQTKSPDMGVKGGPSPVDREPCLGGTAGCSEIDECDVKDREDPI